MTAVWRFAGIGQYRKLETLACLLVCSRSPCELQVIHVRFTVTGIDGPKQLADLAPLATDLVRQIPGPDRPDYWIAALESPITVVIDNLDQRITHFILAPRWEGTTIASGVMHLPLGIAYVTDLSLLDDSTLDFGKCHYVAIGMGSDTSDGRATEPLRNPMAGTIGRTFGLGKKSPKT
jgi:hypothetical protein